MDADERRRFLRERLKALVEADSLETIVEYLLSFNVSSIDTQKEIVCFLEDHVSKGFRHTVKSIVADYLGANTNAKSTRKSDVRKSSCLVIASSKKTGKKGASSSVDGASEASKCGCMATRHKYSSSCTACGRIVCEEENSGVCFFCETPILPPMSADEAADYGFDTSTLAAYRQKDKLLVFDRENAKRTQVHDAQADYYETGTWLSEEEKLQIDSKEAGRREALKNSKRKDTFTLSVSARGARLVEASSMPHFPETEEVLDGRSSSTHQKAVVCAPHLDEVDDTEFTDWNDGLTGVSSSFPLGYEFGNKMLAEHGGKAGDVYRLLKASTAPPPPTASMAGTSLTPASKSGEKISGGGMGGQKAVSGTSDASGYGRSQKSRAAATKRTPSFAMAAGDPRVKTAMSSRVQHSEVDFIS